MYRCPAEVMCHNLTYTSPASPQHPAQQAAQTRSLGAMQVTDSASASKGDPFAFAGVYDGHGACNALGSRSSSASASSSSSRSSSSG
jgi:hypothetical protein